MPDIRKNDYTKGTTPKKKKEKEKDDHSYNKPSSKRMVSTHGNVPYQKRETLINPQTGKPEKVSPGVQTYADLMRAQVNQTLARTDAPAPHGVEKGVKAPSYAEMRAEQNAMRNAGRPKSAADRAIDRLMGESEETEKPTVTKPGSKPTKAGTKPASAWDAFNAWDEDEDDLDGVDELEYDTKPKGEISARDFAAEVAQMDSDRNALREEYNELNNRVMWGKIGVDYTAEDVDTLAEMEKQLDDYDRQIRETKQEEVMAGQGISGEEMKEEVLAANANSTKPEQFKALDEATDWDAVARDQSRKALEAQRDEINAQLREAIRMGDEEARHALEAQQRELTNQLNTMQEIKGPADWWKIISNSFLTGTANIANWGASVFDAVAGEDSLLNALANENSILGFFTNEIKTMLGITWNDTVGAAGGPLVDETNMPNIATALHQGTQSDVAYFSERAGEAAWGNNKSDFVNKHLASFVQNAPFILISMFSAPAAATTEGLEYMRNLFQSSGFETIRTICANAVNKMAQDTSTRYAFAQSFGDSYEQAKNEIDPENKGGWLPEFKAILYATVNSYFNALIETGGGQGSGIETYWGSLWNGGGAESAIDSLLGEVKEEELQGFFERGLQSIYKLVAPFSMTDPNAILNPQVILDTAKDTFIDTAIMMGVETGVQRAVSGYQESGSYEPFDLWNMAYDMFQNAEPEDAAFGNVGLAGAARMQPDSGTGTAVQPIQEDAAAVQADTPAGQVEQILSGPVSNRQAETILNNPELRTAFEERTGTTLQGSKSEQRNQVKAAATNATQGTTEAAKAPLRVTPRVHAGEQQTAMTPAQRTVRDAVKSLGVSEAEAEILTDGLNIGSADAQTYANGIREVYNYAKIGLSAEQVRQQSVFAEQLTEPQFRHAFDLGAQKAPQAKQNATTAKASAQNVQVDRVESAVASLGEYSAEAADAYVEGQDVGTYSAAMTEAVFLYAQNGVDLGPVVQQARERGGALGILTDSQVQTAMQIGGKMAAARTAETQAKARQRAAQRNQAAGRQHQAGKVTYATGRGTVGGVRYRAVDQSKLSKTQKAVTRVAEAIARASGLDIRIADFGKGVGGEYFRGAGGVIFLNINATYKGNNISIGSLTHEMTHWLQEYAPAEYAELKQAVIEELARNPQEFADIFGERAAVQPDLSPDELTDEMVANACQTMFMDEGTVRHMVEQHRGLMERIRDFFNKLINDIKAAFSEIDTSSDFTLYREVRAAEGAMEQMREIFNRAFDTATENLQAEKAQGSKKAATKGGVQNQAWENKSTEIGDIDLKDYKAAKGTDGKPLFQVYAFEHDEAEYREMLTKWGGMSTQQVDDLFKLVDAAMDKIKGNLEALDYAWEADIDDRSFMPVKQNSDKLYKVSQDFSTLCRKRILQGVVSGQLSASLQRGLTKEEGIAVRDALIAIQQEGKQIEVACALCYVESARMRSQKAIQEFLNDPAASIQNYFAGKSGSEATKAAEAAERQKIWEEYGMVRGKGDDETMYDIRDTKTATMSKIPTNLKKRIQDAKKDAKKNIPLTAEQQAVVDEAGRLPVTAFTTPEGLQDLAKNHRDIFNAFVLKLSAASKSKGIENDTWWRAGDSKAIGDALIQQMNAENGLRTQSWSDFQVKHLMDYIAATIELSTRGAQQHAYTKVLDYVELMGNTGVMINMSLIPTREFSGKLEYDNIEGFVYEDAMRMREKFPDTAGTICIGMDDEQVRQLLASTDIDYVIPYHQSGMSKATRAAMHIPAWKDFQNYQGEKKLNRSEARANAEKYGVELLSEDDPNWHEAPNFSDWYDQKTAEQDATLAGKSGDYGVMTGGYTAMQNAAENYKRICAERGLMPKFSYGKADFSNEANYWKLLIDRKMVNNQTGDIIEQKPLKPIFDFDTVQRILNDELDRYGTVKADQEEAIERVTQAFLSGKVKGGMSSDAIAKAMQKPVDNVPIVNITENAAQMQVFEDKAESVKDAALEDNEPAVAETNVQFSIWEGEPPKKTQYGFKLMTVKKVGDQWLPTAMFIDRANPYEFGQWYKADSPKLENLIHLEPGYSYLIDENDNADMETRRPFKKTTRVNKKGQKQTSYSQLPSVGDIDKATLDGKRWMLVDRYADGGVNIQNLGVNGSGSVSKFALRPGIHAVDIPSMAHIGAVDNENGGKKRRTNERWFLIEYPVDVDYNQEAYSHESKDIRDHLPTGGWYSYQTNSGAEARQHWFITGGMKIVGAVSEADVRKYAKDRGFEQDLQWRDGKVYSEDDAIDLDEYLRTTTAQPTPSKAEMRQRIESGVQMQAWGDAEGVANERLEPITGELRDSLLSSGNNTIVDSHEKVVQLVNDAFDNPSKHGTGHFGVLTPDVLNEIQNKATNVNRDLQGKLFRNQKGYMIVATYSAIRHLNEDQNLTREEIVELLDRLPDIIIDNDTVKFTYYTEKGQKEPGLLFEKKFPDGMYGAFNLISGKRRRLGLQTMYIEGRDSTIKKSPHTPPLVQQPQPTSKTTGSQAPSGIIIPETGKDVKGQFQTWDEGPVYNNRALVSEETVDKWLSGGWFGSNTNPNYAQAYIAYMRPDQYLRLSTIYDEGRIYQESEGRTMDWVKDASEGQPIQLKIDTAEGKVYDHEGRHRMVVLSRNGVRHVPVLLFDMDTKYSKEPLAELKLEGQNFNGVRNYATTTVEDLVPLNKAHREEILEKFSKKTSFEKISEKYDRYQTFQFQQWDNPGDDTTSEKQGRQRGYARLQSENAILGQTVKELKRLSKKQNTTIAKLQNQMRITKTPEVRENDARKLAKALIAETGSEANVKAVTGGIKALGDYLLNTNAGDIDEKTLKGRARAIANEILGSATADMTFDDETMEVNPYEVYMGEAVEEMANRIVMDAMSGVLRPTAPTKADKQKARAQALREQIQTLKAEKKLGAKEAASLYNTIYDLSLALDKAESRYETLRQEADYRSAQLRAEGAARAAEIRANERARAANLLQSQKAHYLDIARRAKERREESAGVTKYRKQVEQKAKKLYEMLLTNSNDLHVPEVLKGPLGEFLESLDFTSKRQLAGGPETRADEKFGARLMRLQQMLANQQSYINGDESVQSDLGGYIDVSPEILDYLRQMSEMITTAMNMGRTFTINQMSAADLKILSDFLSNLRTAIRNMNSFMANARYESVREAANADIDHMKALGRAAESEGSNLAKFTTWENGVPYYIFKRFGEGGKAIFDGFTKGWEKMAMNAQEIIAFTEKLYTDKEVRKWKTETHDITLEDGSKIRMTTAQIMELSQLLGREQALRHIGAGGIRVGDTKTKKGKIFDTTHHHLTDGDIKAITGLLSNRQLTVAKAMQQFMAKRGAEWGNEISMRRFGYNFYTEGEGYYPIKTDANDRPMADTDAQTNSMFRLLNLSSSKSLNPKASNALIVGDIFDTFSDHMADMAKLNGMGLPILDAIKWFNYKERIDRDDGTYDTKTLQGAMEQAFGGNAGHYFRTLMKDINGQTETGDRGMGIGSKLLSNYKAAAVGANLRVAMLQPTSYVRALTVLKPQYLAGAFAHRNAYKEAMQYSGTAVWKSLGYYDTDISKSMRGQIEHDDTWRDKIVEKSMALAELGDKRTWGRLWVACKMQTKAETGLEGEALKQATADLFREVIYSSQVMDATLTRSEIMRGKGVYSKMSSAFMAEPTLSYNILIDAVSQYNLDVRKNGKAGALRRNSGKIGKAFIVYLNSAAFSAVVESLADAARDDDDDEFWDKFLQAFLGEDDKGNAQFNYKGNFIQDLSILGKMPIIKNWISNIQGYNSGDMTLMALSNGVKALQIWWETYKLATGELDKATAVTYYGNMTQWGKIYKTMQAMSQLSGLPAANAARDAIAIWNNVIGDRKPDWKVRTYDSKKDRVFRESVAPSGVSYRTYNNILADADTDGSGLSQVELSTELTNAIARGDITEAQAEAIWNAKYDKKTFAQGKESAAKAKAEAEKEAADPDYAQFKTDAPVYSTKTEATYNAWKETVKPLGVSMDTYISILNAANTDGNTTVKQDEMGDYLVKAIRRGELTEAQADAIWRTHWNSKNTFAAWRKKH